MECDYFLWMFFYYDFYLYSILFTEENSRDNLFINEIFVFFQ